MKIKIVLATLLLSLCFTLTFTSIAHALAVPKPEARGVTISGGRVVAAGVATAAAVFNQPDQWGVHISGAELRGSGEIVEIPAVVVRLDTVDLENVTFLSPNEAEFRVPWISGAVEAGSRIRMCVQLVKFTPRGMRFMGSPDCFQSNPI